MSSSLLLMSETTADDKYEDKQKTIKIKGEVQQYPNKPLKGVIMSKLPNNGNKKFL